MTCIEISGIHVFVLELAFSLVAILSSVYSGSLWSETTLFPSAERLEVTLNS